LATGDLDLGGRISVELRDEGGAPVPFAAWKIGVAGRSLAQGRAGADGRFSIFPRDLGIVERASLRLEIAARGAARVLDLDSRGGETRVVNIGRPRGLSAPIDCDLVFVLDTTVSMAGRLAAVKRAIGAAELAAAGLGPGFRPRLGLVLFRDVGDDYLTRVTPLDAGPLAFEAALAQAEARGGGDIPEALGAGLAAAIGSTGFSDEGLRLVFLLTDAAPKAAAARAGSPGLPEAARAAAAAGARVYAIGLEGLPAEGERALRELAAYTGGAFIGSPAAVAGSLGATASYARGDLSDFLARILAGEAQAAAGAGGAGRGDPALAILDEASKRMAAALSYPEAARQRGLSGTVRVELEVGADGGLVSARIGVGSGSAILDRAAIALASSVFPLPNRAAVKARLSIAVTYSLR
jgi:TonB family protein